MPPIVSFLTLHILNFTTTLAPASLTRPDSRSSVQALGDYRLEFDKVDITSRAVASALDTIAALNPLDATMSPVDVLAKVAPPLHTNAIPPSPAHPRALFRSSEIIDNFMSGWTNLVGDPIISKWIVFVLAASMVLNGYLLKGIAEGAIRGLQPQNVRFRSVGPVNRGRDVNEKVETPPVKATAIRRKPAFAVGPPRSRPDSGTTNSPETMPSTPLGSKPILAPIAIPTSNESNGAPALLLDMKLRA